MRPFGRCEIPARQAVNPEAHAMALSAHTGSRLNEAPTQHTRTRTRTCTYPKWSVCVRLSSVGLGHLRAARLAKGQDRGSRKAEGVEATRRYPGHNHRRRGKRGCGARGCPRGDRRESRLSGERALPQYGFGCKPPKCQTHKKPATSRKYARTDTAVAAPRRALFHVVISGPDRIQLTCAPASILLTHLYNSD